LQFQQFSSTIADAAIQQQQSLRDGYASIANSITASSMSRNDTWPLCTLPLFETYAKNFFVQSRAEVLTVFNRVLRDERANWEEYATAHYQEWIKQGHMFRYGSLDNLDPNTTKYHPFISAPSPYGFIPEEDHEVSYPTWSYSPPPRNYGLVNWDLLTISDYADAVQALLTLKNETIATRVRPYRMFSSDLTLRAYVYIVITNPTFFLLSLSSLCFQRSPLELQ